MKRGPSIDTTNENERLARIDIPITGMSCASCVRRVERALSKKDGVAEASVNLASERASVAYDPTTASPGEMVGVIKDAGYDAGVRETTLDVSGMTCASCVSRVDRALKKVPGVLEANVNVANEKATIRYLAGELELQDLEKAIEEAGYGVVRGAASAGDADMKIEELTAAVERFLKV